MISSSISPSNHIVFVFFCYQFLFLTSLSHFFLLSWYQILSFYQSLYLPLPPFFHFSFSFAIRVSLSLISIPSLFCFLACYQILSHSISVIPSLHQIFFFFFCSQFLFLVLSLSHLFPVFMLPDSLFLSFYQSHLFIHFPLAINLFLLYSLSHILNFFFSSSFCLAVSCNQYLYFHSQSLSTTPPPPPFLCCLCHFFHFDPRAACVIIFPFCDNHNLQAERIEANSQLDDETCPFYVVSKKFASIFIKTSSTPAKNKHLTEKSCSY